MISRQKISISKNFQFYIQTLKRTLASSSNINIEKLEEESVSAEVVEEDVEQREREIEAKRNKSRLHDGHRRLLMEENPYPEPQLWHHGTLKYLRRTYGRFGSASGVNPSICWPVKQELQDILEYEKVTYPFTIPEMMEQVRVKRQEKEERKRLRQEDIVMKMQKMDQWMKEFQDRVNQKESEAMAARARRERLIEEVRSHFGFTVDPKDERFKEMLEKKEKEQKKLMKEARKKAREEKMVEKLLKKKSDDTKNEAENETK